jgi:hypothetical protein
LNLHIIPTLSSINSLPVLPKNNKYSAIIQKKTLKWLEQKNIKIVSKADNHPNVPQARPIENFLGVASSCSLCAKGWEAKTPDDDERRSNKVTQNS